MYETDKLRYEKEMSSYSGPGGGSIPRHLEDVEEGVLEAPPSMDVEEPVDSQDEESGSADSSPYSEDSN